MNARPVLLIDRDGEWCARVCRFLEPHGIPVIAAADVREALQTIEHAGTPTAFVMEMDARQSERGAISTLRRNDALREVPVGFVNKAAALDMLLLMVMPQGSVRAA
jgi:CheY-like chemotaxis protein